MQINRTASRAGAWTLVGQKESLGSEPRHRLRRACARQSIGIPVRPVQASTVDFWWLSIASITNVVNAPFSTELVLIRGIESKISIHIWMQTCLQNYPGIFRLNDIYKTELTISREAQPQRVGNFGLRGSISARLAGTIALNEPQVTGKFGRCGRPTTNVSAYG